MQKFENYDNQIPNSEEILNVSYTHMVHDPHAL